MHTNPYVLCLGASAECAPFVIDSFNHGYSVLAIGLDIAPLKHETKDEIVRRAFNESQFQYIELDGEKLLAFEQEEVVKLKEVLTTSGLEADFDEKYFTTPLTQAPLSSSEPLELSSQKSVPTSSSTTSLDSAKTDSGLEQKRIFNLIALKLDISKVDEVIKLCTLFKVKYPLPTPIGYMIKTLGKINDYLGLKGISEAVALNFTDKLRVHELQEKSTNGCHSWFYHLLTEEQILDLDQTLEVIKSEVLPKQSFPLMLKPRFGSGSRYAYQVNSLEEIAEHLKFIASLILNKRAHGNKGMCFDMLLEKFIQADYEFSTNGIIKDGKVVALINLHKVKSSAYPHCQEIAYTTQLAPKAVRDAVVDVLNKNLEVLKIENSVLLCDVLVKDNQAYIIDIAGRHTGYFLHRIFTLAQCNLVDAWFDYVLPQDLNVQQLAHMQKLQDEYDAKLQEALIFNHFLDLKEGVLSHIASKEELLQIIDEMRANNELTNGAKYQSNDFVLEYQCNVKAKDHISKEHCYDGRIIFAGRIMLKHVTPEEGLKICKLFMEKFKYEA